MPIALGTGQRAVRSPRRTREQTTPHPRQRRRGEPHMLGARPPPGREGHGEVQGPMGRHEPLLLQHRVQPVRRDTPLPLLHRLQTQEHGLVSGAFTAG